MEFVEAMKKWNEMCNGDCSACPVSLENNGHSKFCFGFLKNHPDEAEKIIAAWQKPIDWSKVKVDTPILVRDNEFAEWLRRYFAKYEGGKVFAWNGGKTSWSLRNDSALPWKYAKLWEGEEE